MNWEARHKELIFNGQSGLMTREIDYKSNEFCERLKQIIPAVKYSMIMDYGCSSGKYLVFLMDYFEGSNIIGYELSELMIAFLIGRFPFFDFAIPDGKLKKVDLIFCSFVLQHISDGEAIEILKKFNNALNEGGKGYIINSMTGGQYTGDMSFRGIDEHHRLCQEAGLNCDLKGIIMYDKVKIGVFEIEKQ